MKNQVRRSFAENHFPIDFTGSSSAATAVCSAVRASQRRAAPPEFPLVVKSVRCERFGQNRHIPPTGSGRIKTPPWEIRFLQQQGQQDALQNAVTRAVLKSGKNIASILGATLLLPSAFGLTSKPPPLSQMRYSPGSEKRSHHLRPKNCHGPNGTSLLLDR